MIEQSELENQKAIRLAQIEIESKVRSATQDPNYFGTVSAEIHIKAGRPVFCDINQNRKHSLD